MRKEKNILEPNRDDGLLIKDILFAILFAVGKVSLTQLCENLDITSAEAWYHLKELEKGLKGTPLVLLYAEDQFRLATRPEYSSYISRFSRGRTQKLSNEAIETLAVIISKQPCTRAEIEKVRGVDCEKTISALLKARFIKPVGNIKKPGSPVLYTITDDCLFALGVKSYHELMNIIKDRKEDF